MLTSELSEGSLSGTVRAKEYLGFTTSLTLDVANHVLKATLLSSEVVRRTTIGSVVPVGFDWSRVSVIPGSI